MVEFEDIKEPLSKVLRAIYADRSKLRCSTSDGGLKGGRITAWRLEQAAGNHLFDDCPEVFGINKMEGHRIRQYFEEDQTKRGCRNYISVLHREFSDIMDEEDSRYIEDTNKQREKEGLPLIEL